MGYNPYQYPGSPYFTQGQFALAQWPILQSLDNPFQSPLPLQREDNAVVLGLLGGFLVLLLVLGGAAIAADAVPGVCPMPRPLQQISVQPGGIPSFQIVQSSVVITVPLVVSNPNSVDVSISDSFTMTVSALGFTAISKTGSVAAATIPAGGSGSTSFSLTFTATDGAIIAAIIAGTISTGALIAGISLQGQVRAAATTACYSQATTTVSSPSVSS